MELLNILIEHKIILSILIGILIINFGCIFYLVFKEKKADKKEIDEILNELEDRKDDTESHKRKDDTELTKKQDEKVENNKKEIEEMLIKMQKDLEAKPEDVVTNFENEQEENSIISYQELVNSVKEKSNNEIKVTPVKIEVEEKEFENEDTLELEPITDKSKKFKRTEFISPIFGKQANKIKYPTVPKLTDDILDEIDFEMNDKINNNIDNTKDSIIDDSIINASKLKEEMKKNDDFLKALKDFRKNLD